MFSKLSDNITGFSWMQYITKWQKHSNRQWEKLQLSHVETFRAALTWGRTELAYSSISKNLIILSYLIISAMTRPQMNSTAAISSSFMWYYYGIYTIEKGCPELFQIWETSSSLSWHLLLLWCHSSTTTSGSTSNNKK